MSLIIIWSSRIPVVRVARMAGQFAKPRTSDFETVGGQRIPSYKGDSINGFDVTDRKHDPNRLLSAYFHSVATQNYLRAMITGGVSDLHSAPNWKLDNILSKQVRDEYETVVEKIIDGLNFYETIHAEAESTKSVSLFCAHEGLILDYEAALTRPLKVARPRTLGHRYGHRHGVGNGYEDDDNDEEKEEEVDVRIIRGAARTGTGAGGAHTGAGDRLLKKKADKKHYNLGAHFIWIGDRTRQLTGAHIEYFRGIENPIGVKIGPSTKEDELVALIRVLNPNREAGRLTLITRYGVDLIDKILPLHIRAAKSTNTPILWICDPCHGNTENSPSGLKTRNFEKVMGEMVKAFQIHAANGSRLGGVHLELTGDDVTECIGGSAEVEHSALSTNYQSFCDPRLNYTQSLDMAFHIARELNKCKDFPFSRK
jgi:3-deoxy-7-phosphoheptulonate synthase